MRSLPKILPLCIFAALAAPAAASGPAAQSAGSVRIEITIPAFAQALAASEAGAAGLWTVRTDAAPLMVDLPEAIGESAVEASFFTGGRDLVTATVEQGPMEIVSRNVDRSNGWKRSVFVLHRTGAARHATPGVLLFSAI